LSASTVLLSNPVLYLAIMGYCLPIRGVYTFLFTTVLLNFGNAQKVEQTYNTKINRAHVVYIKNPGGRTYITKADSVIISEEVNKSTQVRDTFMFSLRYEFTYSVDLTHFSFSILF